MKVYVGGTWRLHGTFIAYLSQIIILREVAFNFYKKESRTLLVWFMGVNMQINVTTVKR